MPLLKHAKKKLKQDKKRTIDNSKIKKSYKAAVKEASQKKTKASLSSAYKAIDKAVKNGLLHKNKAARMKSQLANLISPNKSGKTQDKSEKKEVKKVEKKEVKKTAVKKAPAKKTTTAKKSVSKKASK